MARHSSSGPALVKTHSQRRSERRLALVSAMNQRGQPAFFGIEYVTSVSSSGTCCLLPPGCCSPRDFRPAWLMAPSGPVTRAASNAGSSSLSALLYAARKSFSALAASAFVAAGTTSRSPCTVTQPVAVIAKEVTAAAAATGRQ